LNYSVSTSMNGDEADITCEDLYIELGTIVKAISRLRPDKAVGPESDELSAKLLTEVQNEIVYPLLLLFKKSLSESSIPRDWKQANVTPIFKKGSRNSVENYRPVSLTSQICKLFETVMRDALVHYLENNHLILDSQHGFGKGRSCLTNLLEFLDRVTGCVDAGDSVDVIFLDFAKAFDKVPHRRLVSKLKSHGIQGMILDWISECYGAGF